VCSWVRFPYKIKCFGLLAKMFEKTLVAQRCQWHRCDMYSSIIDTAVTCTTVSLTPLWHAQRCHLHRCDMHSGVIDTAVTGTAVLFTPLCNQLCRLSSRIRSHIRKGFNMGIRGPGEVVWWKKPASENCINFDCMLPITFWFYEYNH
jgi:hypothetical protein